MSHEHPNFTLQSNKKTIVLHFAGDSGDGIQLIGQLFTHACAQIGNDIQTFPDYPAEIRAPQGTVAGVSGFQLKFAAFDIHTPGDFFDVLVAMNPAAFKQTIHKLIRGGMLIIDEDKFTEKDFKRAGLTQNPLEEAKHQFRLLSIPLSSLIFKILASTNLSRAKQRKCKNFFALGLVFWLYQRPMETTKKWIQTKFKHQEDILQANLLALEAGYRYAENSELLEEQPLITKALLPKGTYRQITGNEALALGALLAQQQTGRSLLVAGYPITPASDILQWFTHHKVKTFQAEDEIAAIGAALGASFGGCLALTTTSGPGMDLKSEMLGLAVMVELPLVVIDVQRAGPSTGMPTKVEQSDLWMALYGRHGECPVPVIAASTPADCFYTILEAFQIAIAYMTPVILLSDAYLANGAQPWLIPNLEDLPKFSNAAIPTVAEFKPYKRDEKFVRSWIVPGMEGYEHRIGGLEKTDITGEISYDPVNHEKMVMLRKQRIENIALSYPATSIFGALDGTCLVIGWGSTHGFILTAIQELQATNVLVSYVHLRHLYPLPLDLKSILARFEKILVVEMNSGQLLAVLRATYLLDIKGLHKIKGQPFTVTEIKQGILALLGIAYESTPSQ